MTRTEFMQRLRKGLIGLPTVAAGEIAADYDAHFDDGLAAGRSESEIAEKLGDPDRLARELRAEAGARRWDQEKNPSAAAGAVFAVLGLGAIDILILLPILMSVVGVLFGFFMAAVGLFIGGGAIMVAGPFAGFPGGALAAVLMGIGVMAGAAAIGALTAVASILLVNAVIWFARLHYRLLKPALEPHTQAQA